MRLSLLQALASRLAMLFALALFGAPSVIAVTPVAAQSPAPRSRADDDAPRPRFVLHGVIIRDDASQDGRSALLAEPQLTAGAVQRVAVGAQLGPYRLTRVEPDRVVLEKEGATITVPLGGAPAAKAPPLPTAPPRAAPAPAPSRTDVIAKQRLSELLGISPLTLEAQLQQAGRRWTSLLYAYRLAERAGTPVEILFEDFKSLRNWGAVARKYGVNTQEIAAEVGRFRQAVEREARPPSRP